MAPAPAVVSVDFNTNKSTKSQKNASEVPNKNLHKSCFGREGRGAGREGGKVGVSHLFRFESQIDANLCLSRLSSKQLG